MLLFCGNAQAHEAEQIPHGMQDYIPTDKDCQEIYNLVYYKPAAKDLFVIQYRVYQVGTCSKSVKNVVEAVRVMVTMQGYEYIPPRKMPGDVVRRADLILAGDSEYDEANHDFKRCEGNVVLFTKQGDEEWTESCRTISRAMNSDEIFSAAGYILAHYELGEVL